MQSWCYFATPILTLNSSRIKTDFTLIYVSGLAFLFHFPKKTNAITLDVLVSGPQRSEFCNFAKFLIFSETSAD